MAIVQDWLPPTRENYETLVFIWQFLYPIVSPPPPPSVSLLSTH